VLEEEPLLLATLIPARADERPLAVQLVAREVEDELAPGQALVGIADRAPHPPVPHDHGAGTVVTGRDDPFEVRVLDRMILDLHGHALVGGIGRRPLRHGPRAECPAELEPEVPVEAPSRVLLDDEQAGRVERARPLLGRAERLRRPLGVALRAVSIETVGHSRLASLI
jgi:hypothetical protein